jgi:pimeloyl-ACP methyl ester carboxylesterase
MARGGVVLAPTIGREAYPTRRALRLLAQALASHGFITLRFDYPGTGDSGGNFTDPERDRAWTDSVAEAVALLRSFGLNSVSGVGVRLGATLLGEAAATKSLGLTSLVLWDPYESGRSYLRELSALESLRRENFESDPSGAVETSEYVFSPQAVTDLRRLSLSDLDDGPLAQRVLVVQREDRPTSTKVLRRLEKETVAFDSTTEQGPLLDVEAFFAVMPVKAIERIAQWVADGTSEPSTTTVPEFSRTVVVSRGPGPYAVEESHLKIANGLFGIASYPQGEAIGPWVIFLNSVNDDHVGRARLWVELSRRWASYGLRCVRVDLRGYGDSPWPPGAAELTAFELQWSVDIVNAVRSFSPDDPSNCVLVGLCSGAYVAAEAGYVLSARGVVAINPPVMMDYVHGVAQLETSRRAPMRALGNRMRPLALSHLWIASTLSRIYQGSVGKVSSIDLLSLLVERGTDLLAFASEEDLTAYPRTPLLRSIDLRRLGMKKKYTLEFVPGMDHALHYADARTRTVEVLDRHILTHFAHLSPNEFEPRNVESS